jgi:hypothetical protein
MTEGNFSNVGHRGPVYKGLGAMNPCDNLRLSYHSAGLRIAVFVPTFSLLNQRPVVTVSCDLLSADGKWEVKDVGRVIRKAVRMPGEFIFRKYRV